MKFADAHRNIEKYGIQLLKTIKPVSTKSFAVEAFIPLENVKFLGIVTLFDLYFKMALNSVCICVH